MKKTSVFAGALIVIMLFSCMTLLSCKGPYKDEDAEEILAQLLPKDAVLNGYIWGDSFKTAKDPGDDADSSTVLYYAVSPDMPYTSIDELKSAAAEIYSIELMGIINEYAFENTEITSSRFCTGTDDDGKGSVLKMDITAKHTPYKLTATAILDTVKVKRSSKTVIEAELEYESAGREGRRSMEIVLINEGGSWKIDSQTWIIGVK